MKKITLLILTLLMSLSGFSQALDETFDSVADGSLPTGWTRFDNAQGVPAARRPWTVQSVNSSSAPKAVLSERYQIGIGNTLLDWLVTPAVTVPPNGQLQFNTRQGLPGDQGGLYQILVSLTPPNSANTSSFSQVVEFTETQISNATTAWELKTVPLPNYVGQTVYIAFVKKSFQASANPNTTVDSGWYIDDVRVQSKCLTPTDLRSVENRLTSSDLTWTRQSGETAWDVVVAREEQTLAEAITQTAFPDLGGIKRYTGTLPYKTNENGITLAPGSFYKFYVRAVCSETNVSDWTEPYYFVSLGFGETCAAPIVIPRIGFSVNSDTAASRDRVDTMQGPNCIAGANTVNYMAGNDVFYSFVAPTTGEVRIKMTPNAPNSSLFVYASCPTPGQACLAGVANNGSATRIISNLAVTAGNTYIVVLSSSAATQTYAYYLEIQYVFCAEPTNLNATTPTQTSAVLSWTNPIPATKWEIAVQPSGESLPEGAGYSVTTGGAAVTSFTTLPISNLTNGTALGAPLAPSTAYQYWVRGECTLNGTTYSPWAGPFQFFTPVCEPVDQCNHTFVLQRNGTAGWNGAVMHVKQNGVVVKVLGPQFTSGAPQVVTVPLCKNVPVELVWVSGGATPNNVGVIFNNSFGQQLFQKATGTGAPSTTPLYTGVVLCDVSECLKPINQNFNAVTTSSATLTWTPAGNNPAATGWQVYVIPASEATVPTAGESVTSTAPGFFSGPAIVSGYVASGLRSDTDYVYYLRTVCDASRGSDWVGPMNFTTLVSCAFPTNLTAEGQTRTSAILKWNQVPATITSWEVVLQNPGLGEPAYTRVGVPVSTTSQLVYDGVTPGTTALAAGTEYEYYVRAICSGTDKSRWVGPFTFRTLCDAINVPYTEGFNSGSVNQRCWTALNGAGTNVWNMDTTTTPFEGDQSASILPIATGNNSYLISPTLNLLANYRVRFRYKVESATANNTVKVLLSTTGIAPANFTTELWSSTFRNVAYEERTINLDNVAPGQINIAFHLVGAASASRIYIDNVVFEPIPACPAPQDLAATDIESTTATLSWSAGHNETQWQIVVQPAGTGVPPVNYAGATTTNNLAYPANTNGDLNPANPYEYYVRAYCSATDQSTWVGPFNFKTLLCNVADRCTYRFTMTDTASNGWGTTMSMSVIQNNVVVATLTGPPSGSATSFVDIDFCPGIQFELRWNAGTISNAEAAQVGISIANSSSTVIYTKAPGAGVPNSSLYRGMPFCTALACPFPTNLSVSQTSPTSAQLTWTPGGTETAWQYVYQPAGGNYPGNTPGLPANVPLANLSSLPQAVKYEFYVRAICGPGNISYWAGPFPFTIYNSPGCLGVDIDGVTTPTGAEITVCPSGPPVHLEATYFQVKSTSSYRVDPIAYNPPFPFTGGENSVSLTTDDYWSNVVNLDFNFCFFGTSYNKLLISDNGAISFSVAGPNGNGGRYTPLAACGYNWTQRIPFLPAAVNEPPYTNAIFGVLQDLNPRTSPADYSFNYEVLGTAPCRAFVVNIYKVASYSCNVPQTSQMVLYEGSNMIDVYIQNRSHCSSQLSGGSGLVGVQGTNNTQFAFPTSPDRNTGRWDTANEAWRFTPDGPLAIPQFEWQLNGAPYSNDLVIDVPVATVKAAIQASGIAKFEAVATYDRCGATTPIVRKAEIVVKLHDMPIADPDPIIVCASATATTFDLSLNTPIILATVPTANQGDYQIDYYLSQAEADSGTTGNLNNSYTTNADTEIFVRIKNNVNGCVEIRSFFVRINTGAPVYTLTGNTTICTRESTTISVTPPATGATYEWILPDGTISTQNGPDLLISPTDAQAGVYTVKVDNGCETVDQFTLTINPDSIPVADFSYTTPLCFANASNPVAIPGATMTAGGLFSTAPGSPTVTFVDNTTGEIDLTATPAGNYMVRYTILGTLCNPEVTFDAPINIVPEAPAIVGFTYTNPIVCANANITPAITTATGFTFGGTFDFAVPGTTGLILNPTTGVVTINSTTVPGTYDIVYSVAADPANCIGAGDTFATPFTITINAGVNSNATFGYSKTSFCLNAPSVTPSFITTPGAGQFSATGGLVVNSVTGEINFNGIAPGNYTVTYTILDDAATCLKGDHFDFNITIDAELDVNIANDCVNASYILTATPDDLTYTYIWKNAAGVEVGTNSSTFNVTEYAETISNPVYPMVFTVTVNNGCDTTETFSVPNIACNIPKGISPNGDGSNDEFDLTGFNVRKLEIFNRYGRKVNSFSSYRKEWHGQSDGGDDLPDGTYYYVIERDGVKTVTGWVQINRQR